MKKKEEKNYKDGIENEVRTEWDEDGKKTLLINGTGDYEMYTKQPPSRGLETILRNCNKLNEKT
jgi:hypothetical protein